jgi:hypothetical protein
MAEHGFNRVDESPTRSRRHFLELVGLGLLAVAGGLLADRLWLDAPAQPAPPADDGYAAAPRVAIKVEGRITDVNVAAGTITVQDDDGGPATVVALGVARGPFYVWQKVKVYGILTSAGSNGATVQAQFIRLKGSDGDDD